MEVCSLILKGIFDIRGGIFHMVFSIFVFIGDSSWPLLVFQYEDVIIGREARNDNGWARKKLRMKIYNWKSVGNNSFRQQSIPKQQYTIFSSKRDVLQQNKRAPARQPRHRRPSLFLPKINKSGVLPDPKWCHWHVLSKGTTQTFLIQNQMISLQMDKTLIKYQWLLKFFSILPPRLNVFTHHDLGREGLGMTTGTSSGEWICCNETVSCRFQDKDK